MGNCRFYLCPEGLIKEEELPDKWGLLYEKNGKIRTIREAKRFTDCNIQAELYTLVTAVRLEKPMEVLLTLKNKKTLINPPL